MAANKTPKAPADPARKITCVRCRGTGMTGHVVVHCGVPGVCFKCDGRGEVYADKFVQTFGLGQKFFGITERTYYNPQNPNNRIVKRIATERAVIGGMMVSGPASVRPGVAYHMSGNVTFTELTEQQAREFFAKYGVEGKRYPEGTTTPDDLPADRRARAWDWERRSA